MLIPEEKVQEILERTDIVGLVGSRVELKRAGRSLKGLCPFHGERTPSFIVNPERKRFKCFGCGEGGDAIAFVMKQEGKSFVEAAKDLAALAGVRLDDAGDDALQREKLAQRRVHQLAARFFMERLWDKTQGQQARSFLKKRGLTAETVKQFQLGYAPAAWAEFSARAAKEGQLEVALTAGLISPRKQPPAPPSGRPPTARPTARQNAPGTYDFFRSRLMIPINNADGATVAFGGRILEGDDPRKFMNSRESAIYKKSELLYAIDHAAKAIRKTGQALLVEGYFDAIVLHQAGLTNAVALCSASLTADQIKLLRRFEAKEIVLVLDGDDAGRRGVAKAAGALLATAMPTRVMVLPTGKDPDEHVLAIGGERFKQEVAAALPLTEHLIQNALPNAVGASFEARLRGLEELKPILLQVPEGLERALFLRTLSERLGIPEAVLAQTLNKGVLPAREAKVADAVPAALPRAQPTPQSAPPPPSGQVQPPRSARPTPLNQLVQEEALLLAHVIHDPELVRLPQAAELEVLSHLGLRAAAAAFAEAVLDGKPLAQGELLSALDPGLRRLVEELIQRVVKQTPHAHREEFLQRTSLHRLHLSRREGDVLQAQLRELAQRIAEHKRRGELGPALDALLDEHLRLTEEKQTLSRARRARPAVPKPLD